MHKAQRRSRPHKAQSTKHKAQSNAILRTGIPLLIGAMIVTTGVATVVATFELLDYAGQDRFLDVCWKVFWIVLWTGLAEGISLAIGWLVYEQLTKRIVGLQTEMSDLIRGVLHDLKTPITHMRNAAEECLNGLHPPETLAPAVLESCETLSDVINANAEITRTVSGCDTTSPETLDVVPLARQSVELYSALAEEKGIALIADLPAAPLSYPIHKAQFHHIVNNLLDNAIKFTPTGGKVSLILSSDPRSLIPDTSSSSSPIPHPSSLTLRVTDTGIGIAKDKQPHIFERFYRADPSRHAPGYGLGLTLVAAIVNSYKGELAVASEIGKGATFTITLPPPTTQA